MNIVICTGHRLDDIRIVCKMPPAEILDVMPTTIIYDAIIYDCMRSLNASEQWRYYTIAK